MRNHDLVVFGEDWASHPSSTQHLIKRQLNSSKVLWINSIGLRQPGLSYEDMKRVYNKAKAMMVKSDVEKTPHHKNLTIVNPKTFPAPQSRWMRQICSATLSNNILNEMAKVDISRPILWTSLPTAVDIVGKLGECASVYYCGDDFQYLAGVDNEIVTEMEAELAEKVDLILVASRELEKKFPPHKTQYLPHGTDFNLFSAPCDRPCDLPVGKPIAGFYGSIENWVDVSLIGEAANVLPEWNFVLIGDIKTDVSILRNRDNVFFLGKKLHHQLPAYVQNWHVAMLPFLNNEQIHSCNPLKLREYLASGTPIVSTRFPAAEQYQNQIYISDSEKDFIDSIVRSSFDVNQNDVKQHMLENIHSWSDVLGLNNLFVERQCVVANDSWESRSAQLSHWLQQLSVGSQ